ncbi:MAG: hypothetical protein AVDCRST_MAG08-3777, partial [uncultured Acetobacteraceae bacterium]
DARRAFRPHRPRLRMRAGPRVVAGHHPAGRGRGGGAGRAGDGPRPAGPRQRPFLPVRRAGLGDGALRAAVRRGEPDRALRGHAHRRRRGHAGQHVPGRRLGAVEDVPRVGAAAGDQRHPGHGRAALGAARRL